MKSELPPGHGMQDARRSQLYGGFRPDRLRVTCKSTPDLPPASWLAAHLSGHDRLTSEGHYSTKTFQGVLPGAALEHKLCSQAHLTNTESASNFRVTLEVSGQSGF